MAVSIEAMLRKITVLLLAALPVLLIPFGTSVSAAPTAAGAACPAMFYTPGSRGPLFLNVCGPVKVTRGVNYGYDVVLTTRASHRKIKLSVIYYDPITRSSIPYRRAYRTDYGQYAAVWTLKNFKPGRTFRVSFRLPFKEHNDKKGSNFTVDVRAYGPSAVGGVRTYDVYFVKK